MYLSEINKRTNKEHNEIVKQNREYETKKAIEAWLADYPEIGTLNGGKFYVIRNGEMVNVPVFANPNL